MAAPPSKRSRRSIIREQRFAVGAAVPAKLPQFIHQTAHKLLVVVEHLRHRHLVELEGFPVFAMLVPDFLHEFVPTSHELVATGHVLVPTGHVFVPTGHVFVDAL